MAKYIRQPAFIKILSWNCLGLRDIPKRREFHQALLDENIDVALLQETLLNPGDRLVFSNYDVIRADRLNGRGGGLAVLVKRGIDYHRSANAEMQSIEAAFVVVNMTGGVPLKITSAPDVIDFAISKNCRYSINSRIMYDISSDHLPVVLEVGNEQPLGEDTPPRKRIDWELYKLLLREFPIIRIINDENGVDAAQSEWTSFVQRAIQRAAVLPVQRPGRPFLPADIRQKISDKRAAIKQAKRSRHPDDIRRATNLVHEVRNALHEFRNEQWNEYLEGMLDSSIPLWRVAKLLKNGRRDQLPHIHGPGGIVFKTEEKAEVFADVMERQFSPNYDLDNDLDEEQQIVRTVRRYFRANDEGGVTNVGDYSPEDSSSEDSSTEASHSTLAEPHEAPHCTPAELLGHIKDLKVRKAPGGDQITNKALKLLSSKALTYLVAIINAILRTQYFPVGWKTAEVIMIPKKVGSIFPQDDRPISLLSAASKLAEKIRNN
nr:unnamed protein product [Callosobruchus analis]